MTPKVCKNCKHWDNPHNGMWEPENWGSCGVMMSVGDKESVVPLCEDCVAVVNRVDDLELVTGPNFGCVHFKKKTAG